MICTMPEGDAVRVDGTLKDASEMEWPNSPSDLNPPELWEDSFNLKRKQPIDEDESNDEDDNLRKAKVAHV